MFKKSYCFKYNLVLHLISADEYKISILKCLVTGVLAKYERQKRSSFGQKRSSFGQKAEDI